MADVSSDCLGAVRASMRAVASGRYTLLDLRLLAVARRVDHDGLRVWT